jgi:calcineurin-like phosphoesterase
MTGPRDGVIGMDRDVILERFLTQLPVRFQVASGAVQLNAVVITVAPTGAAERIERVQIVEESDPRAH